MFNPNHAATFLAIDRSVIPALISGLFAALVGIVSAVVAYKPASHAARESGIQERVTAEREYQLEAMKALREAGGGAKSQIIESVQALVAYLHRIIDTERWDQLVDVEEDRPGAWLILAPFAWREVLHQKLTFSDRTLDQDLVRDEFSFLGYCILLESVDRRGPF